MMAVAFRAFTGEKQCMMWMKQGGTQWAELKLPPGHQTGAISFSYTNARKSNDQFREALLDWDKKNYMMGCGISGGGREGQRADGLITGHAFSLLQVKKVEGCVFLQCRNPWADENEWKGEWSDHSKSWGTDLGKKVKAALRPQFADDGAFWMQYKDWAHCFDSVNVCMKSMHPDGSPKPPAKPRPQPKKKPDEPKKLPRKPEDIPVPAGKTIVSKSTKKQVHSKTLNNGRTVTLKVEETTIKYSDGTTEHWETEETTYEDGGGCGMMPTLENHNKDHLKKFISIGDDDDDSFFK